MMCLYWFLVCITYLSQTNAASFEQNDSYSLPVFVVGLLASVVIFSGVILLCAGDSKATKVEHNDKEHEKRNYSAKEFKNQRNQQAFQEIEFSQRTQGNNGLKKNVVHPDNNRRVLTNAKIETVQFNNENSVNLSANNDTTEIHRDKISSSERNKENINAFNVASSIRHSNQHFEQQIAITPTHELSDYDFRGIREDSYEMVIEQEVGDNNQNLEPRNNRQSREDTRTTDDIGYHSDFSKSIKPDTESSQLSTFRSSHVQSNARSTNNYDVDEDVIETYNDDGESIDWN